jgi:hypothetical protein
MSFQRLFLSGLTSNRERSSQSKGIMNSDTSTLETGWPGVFELRSDGTLTHFSTIQCQYVPEGIRMSVSATYVEEIGSAECLP